MRRSPARDSNAEFVLTFRLNQEDREILERVVEHRRALIELEGGEATVSSVLRGLIRREGRVLEVDEIGKHGKKAAHAKSTAA